MSNISSFFDKHSNDTCYILGDGPSLKNFDYKKLRQYPAICCGLQALHKDFNHLNVMYYSIIEPYLFYPDCLIIPKKLQYLKEHRLVTNEFKKIILIQKQINFFLNLSNILAIKGDNIVFTHRTLVKKNKKFHKFFVNNIDPFSGSFQATLSIALLLGFTKVYLIGFDAFTIEDSPYRWYEKKSENKQEVKTLKKKEHKFLEIYKEHMEILNISDRGTMCNLKNEDYFEHTGAKPRFRENFQLVSKEHFKLLKKRYANA